MSAKQTAQVQFVDNLKSSWDFFLKSESSIVKRAAREEGPGMSTAPMRTPRHRYLAVHLLDHIRCFRVASSTTTNIRTQTLSIQKTPPFKRERCHHVSMISTNPAPQGVRRSERVFDGCALHHNRLVGMANLAAKDTL